MKRDGAFAPAEQIEQAIQFVRGASNRARQQRCLGSCELPVFSREWAGKYDSNPRELHHVILDKLQNAALYYPLGERLVLALKYLQDTDCTQLAVGKIPLQGEQVFALVQDNTTKPREQGIWESHRKYIDVQFVAAGVEEMGYANINTLAVKKPYDEQTDFALFDGVGSFVTVPAGSFTIFFPEDGHIPGLAANGKPAAVRKVVVKVAV